MIRKEYLLTQDGVKIFLRSWIPKEPERAVDAILCIHGLSSHGGEFHIVGNYFSSKGFWVFALDLRGNGLSGTKGDATLKEQLADIEMIVDVIKKRVSRENLWILAHSLGCGYALRYCVNKPREVKGLVLIAPPVKLFMKYSLRTLFIMLTMGFRYIITPKSKLDVFAFIRDEFKESNFGKNILEDPDCVKEYTYRYFMNLRLLSGKVLLDLASKVNAPTLLVQGTKDVVVDPTRVKRLYERLATSRKKILTYEGADHNLYSALTPFQIDVREGDSCFKVLGDIEEWIYETNELTP